MGNTASRAASACFSSPPHEQPEIAAFVPQPIDEELGHSFCYVRSSTPGLSSVSSVPGQENSLFLLGNSSKETIFHPIGAQAVKNVPKPSFRTISGASVSANTSTPPSIPIQEQFVNFSNVPPDHSVAFESSPSFSSIPLQRLPREACSVLSAALSGPVDNTFSSSTCCRHPLEKGFASGPLQRGYLSGPLDILDRSHFSAPIPGSYQKKRSIGIMLKNVSRPVKRVISKTISKTHSSFNTSTKSHFRWDGLARSNKIFNNSLNLVYGSSEVQWAQGKAGEDRVHIVLSEEHGWLFVGIYDGFNGPDAPDFLLTNLYTAVQDELQDLLSSHDDKKRAMKAEANSECVRTRTPESTALKVAFNSASCIMKEEALHGSKKTRNILGNSEDNIRNEAEHSCNMLHVADTVSVAENRSDQERPSLKEGKENLQFFSGSGPALMSPGTELKVGKLLNKMPSPNQQIEYGEQMKDGAFPLERRHKKSIKPRYVHKKRKNNQKQLLSWKSGLNKGKTAAKQALKQKRTQKRGDDCQNTEVKRLDHLAVLGALARALEVTEFAFLHMADQVILDNPELALMGSCVLVMLMRDADVYVMNVGDSRAVLAQRANPDLVAPLSGRLEINLNRKQSYNRNGLCDVSNDQICDHDTEAHLQVEKILEETSIKMETVGTSYERGPTNLREQQQVTRSFIASLQLSSDHSTNVQEELLRIKAEHPEDETTISNERVKGSLKVTRAFGAGFLKQPKWNDALLEMFRIDYIGMAPYITCKPALVHHRLGPEDRFLVLSSDGVYQYMTNEEVVTHVDCFMQRFPDGDPAQHLIEELLFRAAKKAGKMN